MDLRVPPVSRVPRAPMATLATKVPTASPVSKVLLAPAALRASPGELVELLLRSTRVRQSKCDRPARKIEFDE